MKAFVIVPSFFLAVSAFATTRDESPRAASLLDDNDSCESFLSDRYIKFPGNSPVWKLAEDVAPFSYSVLITGETGTGKEFVARLIHSTSRRKNGVFLPVNSAAIPETLVESKFFGHTKGAYTGAAQTTLGVFRAADGGTIFLDEIGDLSLAAQAKILRVLDQREVQPVGEDSNTYSVNVRVIAATNKDLEEEVAAGRFREDLYFRLNTVQINLLPLKDRSADIPLLAQFLLKKHRGQQGVLRPDGFTENALLALQKHSFPGNLRELDNIIARCLVFARNKSLVDALTVEQAITGKKHIEEQPPVTDAADEPADATTVEKKRIPGEKKGLTLEQVEAAVAATGSKRGAARLLGVTQGTVIHWMRPPTKADPNKPE